jgi:rhamnosyltransferase subunit B
MAPEPKRILFAAIGTLGDLHPCIALGKELQRRGHSVTIAATEFYRSKVERMGLSFRAMRPNWNPADQALIEQCENLRTGPEILYRKLILPHLSDTYHDLLACSAGMDLLFAGELVYAAPLVAEKLGRTWVSMILSPSSFFSSYDPSVLVTVPGLIHLAKLGRPTYSLAISVCRAATRHWSNPVRRLRRQQGLRRKCDPVFRDKYSKDLVLALFSPQMARPQPDWPKQTLQTGFVFHDGGNSREKKENGDAQSELSEFLAQGDVPIVFTLGSSAVHHPGNFYEASITAATSLNRRAILVGVDSHGARSQDILSLNYVPFSQVFERAAVIVHQGGSGTIGQALRAGRPMLIVPYGWDQPDNAARMEKLGVGLAVARKDYNDRTATAALRRLLTETSFAIRAREVATKLSQENGLASACDSIELLLKRF